jgi:hypothetical protein
MHPDQININDMETLRLAYGEDYAYCIAFAYKAAIAAEAAEIANAKATR